MNLNPCKHLDYDITHYPKCKLRFLDDDESSGVRYWDRFEGGFITREELEKFPKTATKVQFCKLRGRINFIFDCYDPQEMSCYESE